MLTSRREVESLVERLELHFLANPESNLRFALLTDFVDAHEQTLLHVRAFQRADYLSMFSGLVES